MGRRSAVGSPFAWRNTCLASGPRGARDFSKAACSRSCRCISSAGGCRRPRPACSWGWQWWAHRVSGTRRMGGGPLRATADAAGVLRRRARRAGGGAVVRVAGVARHLAVPLRCVSGAMYPFGMSLLEESVPASNLARAYAWYITMECIGSQMGAASMGGARCVGTGVDVLRRRRGTGRGAGGVGSTRAGGSGPCRGACGGGVSRTMRNRERRTKNETGRHSRFSLLRSRFLISPSAAVATDSALNGPPVLPNPKIFWQTG